MTPKVEYISSGKPSRVEQVKLLNVYGSSFQFTQGINESVDDYNKRIQKYKDELAARQKTENTELLQNALNGVNVKVDTNNLYALKNADEAIAHVNFWQYCLGAYDSSLNAQIDTLKYKQGAIQNQIALLKKEGQDKNGTLKVREGSTNPFEQSSDSGGIDSRDSYVSGQRNLLC